MLNKARKAQRKFNLCNIYYQYISSIDFTDTLLPSTEEYNLMESCAWCDRKKRTHLF